MMHVNEHGFCQYSLLSSQHISVWKCWLHFLSHSCATCLLIAIAMQTSLVEECSIFSYKLNEMFGWAYQPSSQTRTLAEQLFLKLSIVRDVQILFQGTALTLTIPDLGKFCRNNLVHNAYGGISRHPLIRGDLRYGGCSIESSKQHDCLFGVAGLGEYWQSKQYCSLVQPLWFPDYSLHGFTSKHQTLLGLLRPQDNQTRTRQCS